MALEIKKTYLADQTTLWRNPYILILHRPESLDLVDQPVRINHDLGKLGPIPSIYPASYVASAQRLNKFG